MDLNDKLKSTLTELKSKTEKLKAQLDLNADEAHKEFDAQSEKVKEWMSENDINSESFNHKSDEAKEKLKIMFEELQVQLALGKADGKDAIKDHSKKVKKQIHKIKVEFDKDEQFQKLKNNAYKKFIELNNSISVLGIMIEYNIEDGKEMWEKKKKEINDEIDSWNNEIDELKNKSADKIEEVTNEVSNIWNKIKKTF